MLRHNHRDPSPDCWRNLSSELHKVLKQPLQDNTRQAITELVAEIHVRQPGREVTP